MPKDHEHRPQKPPREAEPTISLTAQVLDMHRANRLRSGQSWSAYWGESPLEALARMPRIKHVGELTPDERSEFLRKIWTQF